MRNLDTGRQRSAVVVAILLAILTFLFVFARLYAKILKKLGWGFDDGLVGAGLFFFWSQTVLVLLAAFVGSLGVHVWTISVKEEQVTTKLVWSIDFPYTLALTFARLSMTEWLRKMFLRQPTRTLQWIAKSSFWLSALWGVVYLILPLAHCRPMWYNWTLPQNAKEHCFIIAKAQIVVVSIGIAIDVLIWSIPHFVVWKLRALLWRKIALTAIFSLGIINVLIGICRVFSLVKLTKSDDITYTATSTVIWSLAQSSTAIMLTCCPHLAPIFEMIIPTRFIRTRIPSSQHGTELVTYISPRPGIRATTTIDVLDDAHEYCARPVAFVRNDEVAPRSAAYAKMPRGLTRQSGCSGPTKEVQVAGGNADI